MSAGDDRGAIEIHMVLNNNLALHGFELAFGIETSGARSFWAGDNGAVLSDGDRAC